MRNITRRKLISGGLASLGALALRGCGPREGGKFGAYDPLSIPVNFDPDVINWEGNPIIDGKPMIDHVNVWYGWPNNTLLRFDTRANLYDRVTPRKDVTGGLSAGIFMHDGVDLLAGVDIFQRVTYKELFPFKLRKYFVEPLTPEEERRLEAGYRIPPVRIGVSANN